MSALRLPSAASTPPHLYVKAEDDGHPQDVLLVLRLGMVQDHRTVTVWAVRRERYGDLLIHPAGNRSGGPLPVCRARLASRRLRVTFGFPLGKRCGASLVSSQRLFQLFRKRSFSASARSNCCCRDSTLRSSSFSRSEEPTRLGACIHFTMTQTRRFVQNYL